MDFYRNLKERLKAAGIPEPETEAALLLGHYLGISRHELLLGGKIDAPPESTAALEKAVERRMRREPLYYITGEAPFMGLDFKVDNRVLIPRADTEILVEEALKELNDGSRILDLCTGSGCILISLIKYSNDCEGTGTDISRDALDAAAENAGNILGEDKKTRFLCGDLFEPLKGSGEKFEMIVSNPPYIASGVISTLQSEVRDYEPIGALDGSDSGLVFYERIVPSAKEYLAVGGSLFLEIGYDQGNAVREMMEKEGYIDVRVIRDYAGLDRVVTGIKSVYDKRA